MTKSLDNFGASHIHKDMDLDLYQNRKTTTTSLNGAVLWLEHCMEDLTHLFLLHVSGKYTTEGLRIQELISLSSFE